MANMLNVKFNLEPATDSPKLTDVIGMEQYKSEIEDILLYMKNPEKFKRFGIKVPRGILLAGPPGTGKTLLANAIKNEAHWNFIYTRCVELTTVGANSKRSSWDWGHCGSSRCSKWQKKTGLV